MNPLYAGLADIFEVDPTVITPVNIGSGDRTTQFGAGINFKSFRRLKIDYS